MTLTQIRDTLVAQMESGWSHSAEAPVFYENTTEIDLDSIGDYFVRFFVHLDSAVQINLANNPDHRTYGAIDIVVHGRRNLGTRQVLMYLDDLTNLFKFKTLSGVHLQAPEPSGAPSGPGWIAKQLSCSFYADSNS